MENNEYINKLIANLNAKMREKGETIIRTDDIVHTYINKDFVQFSYSENILKNEEIKECFKNTKYSYFSQFTNKENNFIYKQGEVTDEFIAAMKDKGFERIIFNDSKNTVDFIKDNQLYRFDKNFDSSIWNEIDTVKEQKNLNLQEYLLHQNYEIKTNDSLLEITKVVAEENEINEVKNIKKITFQVDENIFNNKDIQEYFTTRQSKDINEFKVFMGEKGYDLQENKDTLCIENPEQKTKMYINKNVLTDENINKYFRLKSVTSDADAVTFALKNRGQNHTQHHEINYNYIGKQPNENGLKTGYSISESDLKNLLYGKKSAAQAGRHNVPACPSQGINGLVKKINATLQGQLNKGLYKSEEGRAVATFVNNTKQTINNIKNNDYKDVAHKIVLKSKEIQDANTIVNTPQKIKATAKQANTTVKEATKTVKNGIVTVKYTVKSATNITAGTTNVAVGAATLNPAKLISAIKSFCAAGTNVSQTTAAAVQTTTEATKTTKAATTTATAVNDISKELTID